MSATRTQAPSAGASRSPSAAAVVLRASPAWPWVLLTLALTLGAFAPRAAAQRRDTAADGFTQQVQTLRLAGRLLGQVRLVCDIPRCDDEEARATLERLLRFEPGAPIDARALTSAWSRLHRTGLFRSVVVRTSGGRTVGGRFLSREANDEAAADAAEAAAQAAKAKNGPTRPGEGAPEGAEGTPPKDAEGPPPEGADGPPPKRAAESPPKGADETPPKGADESPPKDADAPAVRAGEVADPGTPGELSVVPEGPEPGDGPVDLTFECEGAVVITDLEISYADLASKVYPRQFLTEIRKRLRYRKGGEFPPQRADGTYDPTDSEVIDRQRAQIVKLYTDQGFRGTRVDLFAQYHGPHNKKVRLSVVVDEGSQPYFGQVLLSGNRAFSYSKIVGHISTGEKAHFWPRLFGAFGVGRYDQRLLKEELKEVEQRYREEGFVAARVRLAGTSSNEDREVRPRVRVREGPHVEVIFEGNQNLSDDDLRAVLTFSLNGAWDDTEVDASAQAILDAYQLTGRYYAQVTPSVNRVDRDHVQITYRVVEGRPVYISRVVIKGNDRLKREALLPYMETKGVADDGVISAWGAADGVLQDNRLINDLVALRDHYREQGMPALRFRCMKPSTAQGAIETWTSLSVARREYEAERAKRGEDDAPDRPLGPRLDPALFAGLVDLWSADPVENRCYQVVPTSDPRLVEVHIELDEGHQTTTDRLDVEGLMRGLDPASVDDGWLLFQTLGFADEARQWRRNAGLNLSKLQQVQGYLLRGLHREGYLEAKVVPICDDAADEPGPCEEGRLYGEHVDEVRFEVTPGVQTVVDGILLNGNLRTENGIIRNELLVEDGKPLGTESLFLSQANLRSLGIFDAVRVETLGDPAPPAVGQLRRPATVLVTVEESRVQVFDALIGLQVDSSPLDASGVPVRYVLGASIRDRNFAGRALELGLGVNHANRIDTPQDILGDYAAFEVGPFIKDRRFFNTRLNLNTEATFEQGRTAQRDAYRQRTRFESVLTYDFYNLSYPSRWGQGLRANVGLEYFVERRRNLIQNDERPPFGDWTNSIKLVPSVVWDRRDNPLHPYRGWFASLTSETLFTAADTSALSFKEAVVGQTVHSFFRRRLVIVPSARFGAIQTDAFIDNLPTDFLFKAGGDGVLLPVRGYADASIDACGGVARNAWCRAALPADDTETIIPTVGGRAMMVGSLEARWPTFAIDDFWFAAFTDVGAVAADWTAMEWDRIFPSVGGGLRWLVTGQIPLRLDVAWPLRDTVFAPQEARFHLNIFYTL